MPWPIFPHCSGLFDYIIIRATTFIQMHEDCQGGFSTPKNNRQGPFQPLNICSQLYLYGIFVVALIFLIQIEPLQFFSLPGSG